MKQELAAAPRRSSPLARILGGGTALALIYVGRDALIPFALAIIFSLMMAPFVRRLQGLGFGRTASTWVAVFTVAGTLVATAVIIACQLAQVRNDLPQYEETIRSKLASLREITAGRVGTMWEPASRHVVRLSGEKGGPAASRTDRPSTLSAAFGPMPVEVHLSSWILSWTWPMLETATIVLFVLVPTLLEYEAWRHRFARLLGVTELRLATAAFHDAGERLSRFFILQFAVHLIVGLAIWIGLAAFGLPHAVLLAALTVVLRFIPYAGVWIAALCATSLAAIADPGWSLAIMTLGLFVALELIVSQLVEPHLYRHATGLSPLAAVVSTVFWSSIWGPVGLFISTPLTLCLVVAGRHIKAFNTLEVLLGDDPVPGLRPHFHWPVPSGGAEAFIDRARIFLTDRIAGGLLRRGDSSRADSCGRTNRP